MPVELFRKTAIRDVRKNAERWQSNCYAAQKEQNRNYSTLSGLPVKPLYTPADVEHLNYLRDLGFPGEEPFIRGAHPTMYRGRTWTQRQLAGFGPPEETNKRYKFLLGQGATGINGVFD
jgi:methylmalonyl-CoA mutase N-terminal domain/subunit